MDIFDVMGGRELVDEVIQRSCEESDEIYELMGEIEMEWQRIADELEPTKPETERTASIQDGVLSADSNYAYGSQSLETVVFAIASDAVNVQVEGQNALLEQLLRLEESLSVNVQIVPNLTEMKFQMTKFGERGNALMRNILRLELEFNQMLYADIGATCNMMDEMRAQASAHQDTYEMYQIIESFENEEYRRAVDLVKARAKASLQQSKLRTIRNALCVHNEKNAEALTKIDKMEEEVANSCKPSVSCERLTLEPDSIKKDVATITEAICRFRVNLDLMSTADTQARTEMVRLMCELDDASRAQADLLRVQQTLQKGIAELVRDIGKFAEIKKQVEDFISFANDNRQRQRDLCEKISKELLQSIGEVAKNKQIETENDVQGTSNEAACESIDVRITLDASTRSRD